MPRFSVRFLLLATAVIALAIFAAYSDSNWPRFAYGLAVAASLIGAAIAAVVAKGGTRAFCVGAAVAGAFVFYDLQNHSSLTQVNQTIRFAVSEAVRDGALMIDKANNISGVVTWTVIGVSGFVGGAFGAWVYRKYHEPK